MHPVELFCGWKTIVQLFFTFFAPLVQYTSALIVFIWAAKERQSAYKTAISLRHREICLTIVWIMFIIVAAKKAAEHSVWLRWRKTSFVRLFVLWDKYKLNYLPGS